MQIKNHLKLAIFFILLLKPFVSFSSSQNQPQPEQCMQLFNIAEKIITDAKRQPGTHIQLDQIENKFNESKKQIMQMELETQIKVCNNALIKINQKNKADDSDSN